jgi:anti-sigma B factor antagonist
MDFEVSVRQSGPTTIFDLRGPVMYTEARALHDMVCELLKIGHKKILVNLSNVTRLDSSGIGSLVRTYTAVKDGGGDLKVLHLDRQIQRILEITNLTKILEDYSDEEAALRSFE